MTPQRGRADLSRHLVHLTRADNGAGDAEENLFNILSDSEGLEARKDHGAAMAYFRREDSPYGKDFLEAVEGDQLAVCLTETPVDHLSDQISHGWGTSYDFRPYGLAFDRDWIVKRQGANPVWYLNTYKESQESRWLIKDINDLVDEVAWDDKADEADSDSFRESSVARLTPYLEIFGKWGSKRREFTHEREWRLTDDLWIDPTQTTVLVPENESDRIRRRLHSDFDHWSKSLIPAVQEIPDT